MQRGYTESEQVGSKSLVVIKSSTKKNFGGKKKKVDALKLRPTTSVHDLDPTTTSWDISNAWEWEYMIRSGLNRISMPVNKPMKHLTPREINDAVIENASYWYG